MRKGSFEIISNRALTQSVFEMKLRGDTGAVTAPGQFVQVALPGFFLRRPISVCDLEGDRLTLIYKCVGRGTDAMSLLAPGAALELLTGLGNGYDLSLAGEAPLLIGGGVGVPPLYLLAKKLRARGAKVRAIMGFNTAAERFYEDEFRSLGVELRVTTADGSYGTRGFVTDALPDAYSHVFACGPLPMLKAVYGAAGGSGQFSFEERMGCGFGACMGCSIRTKSGARRVCADGPVFRKEEILW